MHLRFTFVHNCLKKNDVITGAAFADDGEPTKAAEGFAKKLGLEVDQLEIDTTPKGEYLAATVTHGGRSTAEILAEIVPEAISTLRFPRMMRWGRGETSVPRSDGPHLSSLLCPEPAR